MLKVLYAFIVFFCTLPLLCQTEKKSFNVPFKTQTHILADGNLDEPIWESIDSAKDFWEYFPLDSVQARQPSEVKMFFDNTN
ncbi:MAG: hydrolase, partial [Flavobacteriaceae bacterium]